MIEKIKAKLSKKGRIYTDAYEDEDLLANDLLDIADEIMGLQALLISEYEELLKK